MTLTIPQGGITFGRSADTRTTGADIGGEIARFGEAMHTIGTRLVEERDQRLYQTAELQLLDRFNQFELDLSQIGDPDALDDTFRQRAPVGIGDQAAADIPLLDGLGDGLSVRGQERLRMRYEQLRLGTGRNVGRTAIELRQSARRAYLNEAYTVTSSGAAVAAAGSETEAVNADQFAQSVTNAVSAGVITPEQAQERLSQWETDTALARANRAIEGDRARGVPPAPQAVLDALDGQDYAALSPRQRETLRSRATAALDAGAREVRSAFQAQVGEAIIALRAGHEYTGAAAMAANPLLDEVPNGAEFRDLLALHDAAPTLAQLPPGEQRAFVESLDAEPVNPGDGHLPRLASTARAVADDHIAAYERDPLGHAFETGALPTRSELPDPSTASTAEMIPALLARTTQGTALVEGGYTRSLTAWTREERAAWTEAFGIMADPGRRTEAALALAATGSVSAAAPRDLARDLFPEDRVFALTVQAAQHGALAPATVREIFRGQQAIGNDEVALPPRRRINDRFSHAFGPMLEGIAGADLREDVRLTATALAARRLLSEGAEPDDARVDEVFDQALHEIIGGTGRYGDDSSTGGLYPINGVPTPVPAGIHGADVDGAMQGIVDHLQQRFVRDSYLLSDEELADQDGYAARIWQQASVSGNPPDIAGALPAGETLRSLALYAVQGNRYALVYMPPDGPPEFVSEADGSPFYVDLQRLMQVSP